MNRIKILRICFGISIVASLLAIVFTLLAIITTDEPITFSSFTPLLPSFVIIVTWLAVKDTLLKD